MVHAKRTGHLPRTIVKSAKELIPDGDNRTEILGFELVGTVVISMKLRAYEQIVEPADTTVDIKVRDKSLKGRNDTRGKYNFWREPKDE